MKQDGNRRFHPCNYFATVGFSEGIESSNIVGYANVIKGADKFLNGVPFMSFGSTEGHDLSEFVPKSNGEVTDNPFRLWWWNNDSTKGDIGNNYAMWNSFYYVGENEYPIREGDEELVEDGYVWLDEEDPSTFVWTDEKDPDLPIRYIGVKFAQGSGFFAKPTCKNPSLDIAGQVLKPIENVAYVPLKFDADKTMLSNPFPVAVNLADLVPCEADGEKITDNPFRMWWWNNDSTKGDIGNNYAMWNSFYYVGENEYPIREGDEELVEEGYVWLDEDDPSTFVWTDEKDPDLPIRYTDKVFEIGEGFFSKPTCKKPALKFPNPFYKAED